MTIPLTHLPVTRLPRSITPGQPPMVEHRPVPEGMANAASHNGNMLLRDHHPPGDTETQQSNRGTSEMAEGLPGLTQGTRTSPRSRSGRNTLIRHTGGTDLWKLVSQRGDSQHGLCTCLGASSWKCLSLSDTFLCDFRVQWGPSAWALPFALLLLGCLRLLSCYPGRCSIFASLSPIPEVCSVLDYENHRYAA